jgi:methionyl-tRNA synthetase
VWSQAVLPPRVRALVARYLREGLPDMPLAYATDWGIPWRRSDADLRVDVWGEAAVGYLYAVARHVGAASPATVAECVEAWSEVDEVWHFFGIDNAFYYAIMFPALLALAGMPAGKLAGLIVNEFYRLDGRKFSTSRNHAVWAHEFLAEEDPGTVRAFLSWDRPDRSETDFTHAGYRVFRDRLRQVRRRVSLSTLPAGLADQELDRATSALGLAGFDPALAIRCVLAAYADEPARAESILRHITGD